MSRTLLISILAAVAVSIPAAATGSPNATLTGVVGPAFNISLRNADGTNVTHLAPGTYDISVTDNSSEHNFHLRGPGVDQSTDIAGTGTVTWTVTFTDGTHTFLCDAHPVQMRGTFTVGNVQPPPPSPGRLIGKVTSRAISLKTSAGARVKSLAQATYKIAVTDSSKTQNFHLTGPGVNRRTPVGAKVKRTWTVNLKPGTYKYRSDKKRRLRGKFVVLAEPPG
jgi:hypothetical protein